MSTESLLRLTNFFFESAETNNFEYVELNETEQLLDHPDYDNSRPTMLYGYGYTEKYVTKSTQTVLKAFIERNDHNILVIEWSKYSSGRYVSDAIINSYSVGAIIARTLINMRNQGFDVDNFYLVGHSLGGHLVGFIGRNIYKFSNKTTSITRISNFWFVV